MQTAPKANRLHIALFGRRNVGKSSVLNMITDQNVSIVSEIAGTTTDPVEKSMELLPLGPVVLIDTAGIDDVGDLGRLRIEKTTRVIDRTDLAVLVTEAGEWSEYEQQLIDRLRQNNTSTVVVFNKTDLKSPEPSITRQLDEDGIVYVNTIAVRRIGRIELRSALIQAVPADFLDPPGIVTDLVPPRELAVLVVPIDMEAPRGRIILPQVQTIRDLLDHNAYCMVVKEHQLREALARLNRPPALVVTDSQAFSEVAAAVPPQICLTSFSILFARYKGDLNTFVHGTMAIDNLKPGDHVLICEACTHHPIGDDIGRVKIPKWLQDYIGGKLNFTHYQGHDFPDDLNRFKLVIHCGGCVHNRRAMLTRIMKCQAAGVPISNYGLTIACTLGILRRALMPFESAYAILDQHAAMNA